MPTWLSVKFSGAGTRRSQSGRLFDWSRSVRDPVDDGGDPLTLFAHRAVLAGSQPSLCYTSAAEFDLCSEPLVSNLIEQRARA